MNRQKKKEIVEQEVWTFNKHQLCLEKGLRRMVFLLFRMLLMSLLPSTTLILNDIIINDLPRFHYGLIQLLFKDGSHGVNLNLPNFVSVLAIFGG